MRCTFLCPSKGYEQTLASAESDAEIIVELTADFVGTYASYESTYAKDRLPTPASYRADALKSFEQAHRKDGLTSTDVVGLPGREIATVAVDDATRTQLLELAALSDTKVLSSVVEGNNVTTHRSMWAFLASRQACVDCHNRIQNLTGKDQWQLGDIMGAQVVDQNIKPQLVVAQRSALVQSVLLFAALLSGWLCVLYVLNQIRLTNELKLLATIDPLTGCINRRELQDRINSLEGRTNGALLMLDLDNFKNINDTFGHDGGDQVICDFTSRIKAALRTDDWVVRFGGEEFLVWLPDVRPVDAIRLAERVREDAEGAEVIVEGEIIRYTASIGLHIVQNDLPKRFESWIKAADDLLYRAKAGGRNRIVCEVGAGS